MIIVSELLSTIGICVIVVLFFSGLAGLLKVYYEEKRNDIVLDKEIVAAGEIIRVAKELELLKSRVDGLCFKAGFTK